MKCAIVINDSKLTSIFPSHIDHGSDDTTSKIEIPNIRQTLRPQRGNYFGRAISISCWLYNYDIDFRRPAFGTLQLPGCPHDSGCISCVTGVITSTQSTRGDAPLVESPIRRRAQVNSTGHHRRAKFIRPNPSTDPHRRAELFDHQPHSNSTVLMMAGQKTIRSQVQYRPVTAIASEHGMTMIRRYQGLLRNHTPTVKNASMMTVS